MNVKAGYHQKTNLTSYQCPMSTLEKLLISSQIKNFMSGFLKDIYPIYFKVE